MLRSFLMPREKKLRPPLDWRDDLSLENMSAILSLLLSWRSHAGRPGAVPRSGSIFLPVSSLGTLRFGRRCYRHHSNRSRTGRIQTLEWRRRAPIVFTASALIVSRCGFGFGRGLLWTRMVQVGAAVPAPESDVQQTDR